jgi:hypothetical protein
MSSFYVSYTIIYIPTKSSSNEIEGLVVVFLPLQLTLSRIVECSRDHVRLLNDLPNSTTLTQEIVGSSVLPVTEILVIKNHQLDCKPALIPIEELKKVTRGGEWELIKIPQRNSVYIPKSI